MSGGEPAGGVVPGELEEVGPVQPGAVHPHEHLVVDGSGAGRSTTSIRR